MVVRNIKGNISTFLEISGQIDGAAEIINKNNDLTSLNSMYACNCNSGGNSCSSGSSNSRQTSILRNKSDGSKTLRLTKRA